MIRIAISVEVFEAIAGRSAAWATSEVNATSGLSGSVMNELGEKQSSSILHGR